MKFQTTGTSTQAPMHPAQGCEMHPCNMIITNKHHWFGEKNMMRVLLLLALAFAQEEHSRRHVSILER